MAHIPKTRNTLSGVLRITVHVWPLKNLEKLADRPTPYTR
jgi:hypothetical protein